MAALVGWFMLMVPATESADVVAGLGYPPGPPPGKEVPRENRRDVRAVDQSDDFAGSSGDDLTIECATAS